MNSSLKRTLLGISGLLFFACGIAEAQTTIRMEAEEMTLDTYKVEALDFASNGALINLKGPGYVGNATAPFPGASGNYDITVVYHDENDGLAQLSVLIDSTTVDSWALDFKSSESQPKPANRLTREIATGYAVSNGDEIRIDGLQGNWDHANVDYIEFTAGGPDPDVNPPIVLDFSEGDVTIDKPGYYVLDRNWETQSNLYVDSDDVTIDLRGFTLDLANPDHAYLWAEFGTNRLTLKNGTIYERSWDGGIFLRASETQLTGLRIEQYHTWSIGSRCRIENSTILVDDGELWISGDCVMRSNRIVLQTAPLFVRSAHLVGNEIHCESFGGPCIEVEGEAVLARNTVMTASTHPAIRVTDAISEGHNQVIDNLILSQSPGDRAIVVEGVGNMLRGNILRPHPDSVAGKWNYGIVFLQDGNYYGDNLISAEVPFELGGTTQIDLGGNQGL